MSANQPTREEVVDGIMEMAVPSYVLPEYREALRYRWCSATGGCACVGCITTSVGRKITRDEWLAWVLRHDRRRATRDRRRSIIGVVE